MATSRDYYEILGVSKNATADEIKRAYRSSALKWHPDRNKDNLREAETRFKEINQAYEVLSNPEKRSAYDQFGHAAFQAGGFGAGASPFTRTYKQGPFTYTYTTGPGGFDVGDFGFGGFSDPFEIFEQFFGGSPFAARQRQRKPVYSLQIDFMDAVRGTTKEVEIEDKNKTIKIPAGVDDGTRIRFADFDVVVSVRKSREFQRDGNDLYTQMPISYADATLGTVVEVPTIDEPVKLRIKPGTQPNTLVRLRGKGVPYLHQSSRGDQYVRLIVQVPTNLTRRQKELLEELKQTD